MLVEKNREGWKITSLTALSDEEALEITFRAHPEQVVLGEFVEIVDPWGIRIGHVSAATYQRSVFGPPSVTCSVDLR